MKENVYPVAIVGGGSAGTMAVLRSVLNNDHTLFFPGHQKERKKSRALWVKKVENMPAHFQYARGIDQPAKETIQWIQQSVVADKLHLQVNRSVQKIEKDESGDFLLIDNEGESYQANYVVLCTGVMDIQPHINGSIRPVLPFANKQNIDYCLRCDGHHVIGKKTAVLGAGLGAAWVSCMLHERYHPPQMHLLLHGKTAEFDQEVSKLIEAYKIQVHRQEVVEILGDAAKGELRGVVFDDGTQLPVDICFVSLGMIVYNQLAAMLGAQLDQRGFVVTNEKGESSVEGLYIAGDLRANAKKQIYTAWDHAVDALDDINAKIRRAKRQKILL